MTVAFCGQPNVMKISDIEKVAEQLFEVAEELINQGADEFLYRGYGEFDNLCIYAISSLKEKYPDIHLPSAVLHENRKYDPSLYSGYDYPMLEKLLKRLAIIKRNEYMVDKSDVLVVFVKKPFGEEAKTLSYAERKKKRIIRIN